MAIEMHEESKPAPGSEAQPAKRDERWCWSCGYLNSAHGEDCPVAHRAPTKEAASVAPAVSVVNHPPHYNTGKIEVIEMIEDQKLGYHLGNAIKYIMRAGRKGGPQKEIEDLEKAAWYVKRKLALLYAEQAGHAPIRPNDMNPRGV